MQPIPQTPTEFSHRYYGTDQPPALRPGGVSALLRAYAETYPEHTATHWEYLALAEQAGRVQRRLAGLALLAAGAGLILWGGARLRRRLAR